MVAIKDMDMPKNCKECSLAYLDTEADFGLGVEKCVFDEESIEGREEYRAHDCPLIEIEVE